MRKVKRKDGGTGSLPTHTRRQVKKKSSRVRSVHKDCIIRYKQFPLLFNFYFAKLEINYIYSLKKKYKCISLIFVFLLMREFPVTIRLTCSREKYISIFFFFHRKRKFLHAAQIFKETHCVFKALIFPLRLFRVFSFLFTVASSSRWTQGRITLLTEIPQIDFKVAELHTKWTRT